MNTISEPGRWPLEIEHRLTVLEQHTERNAEAMTKMEKRLTLQERGLLAVIIALNALAHEKLPEWAKVAAGIFKMSQAGG